VNSRRASERSNHKPGIIGDQKLIRELRIMNRFTGGIFGKCGRGFSKRSELREARQRFDFDWIRPGKNAIFPQFTRIRGSCLKLNDFARRISCAAVQSAVV
jgi:hypothetical protein